ncbi:MAG: GxxExxY protein [Muribaculaceae bacterium]|nr:GxxExxY protein [Muribaculaceae bacterium]
MYNLNEIGSDIIGAAFEVRKEVGKYLLEGYYQRALAYELDRLGHKVECEKMVVADYKGKIIKEAYRIDLLVDNQIVIECKSLSRLSGNEFKQLNTYLELGNFSLGYIINFSAKDFRPGTLNSVDYLNLGIIRVVRNFKE